MNTIVKVITQNGTKTILVTRRHQHHLEGFLQSMLLLPGFISIETEVSETNPLIDMISNDKRKNKIDFVFQNFIKETGKYSFIPWTTTANIEKDV